jgi:hypothetical protein
MRASNFTVATEENIAVLAGQESKNLKREFGKVFSHLKSPEDFH